MNRARLDWQSKMVLLLVVPFAGTQLVLQTVWWTKEVPAVALWAIGLSVLLALVVLKLRAATVAGAFTGLAITATLMFSTVIYPYRPWRTALPGVLTVSLLAWAATKVGRAKKERLGTAEGKRGRSAAQVAANLGCAVLVSSVVVQRWIMGRYPGSIDVTGASAILIPTLAALSEAAADTVSSEIGQVLGGSPRMITTLRTVEAGTDGAISVAGTLAGVGAALIVAAVQAWAFGWSGYWGFSAAIRGCGEIVAAAVFGLVVDSLLGATLERRGWLNNDGVNFLSTVSAAGFALVAFVLF